MERNHQLHFGARSKDGRDTVPFPGDGCSVPGPVLYSLQSAYSLSEDSAMVMDGQKIMVSDRT
jgi:hypothetical protein